MLPGPDASQAQQGTQASDMGLCITKLEHLRKMPQIANAQDTSMCGIIDGKHFVAAKTNGDGACSLHSIWGEVMGNVPELFATNIRCRLSQGVPRDPADIQQQYGGVLHRLLLHLCRDTGRDLLAAPQVGPGTHPLRGTFAGGGTRGGASLHA